MPLKIIQLETERVFGLKPGDLLLPKYKRIHKYVYARGAAVYVSHRLFHHTYRQLTKHYGIHFHGSQCYLHRVQDLIDSHDLRTLGKINAILEGLPAYGEPGFEYFNFQTCSFRSSDPRKPETLAALPGKEPAAPPP